MEAKRRLKGIMDLISWWIFGKQNWRCGMNQTLSLIVPKSAQIWCFWPLTASTISEVKNDHAHLITQDICNKFIEIKFSVGCMVCPWLRLLHHQLPVKLLIKFDPPPPLKDWYIRHLWMAPYSLPCCLWLWNLLYIH